MKFTIAVTLALLCANPACGIPIDLVSIGNPGNVADTTVNNDGTSGYGSVGYAYYIGKYEVTVGQYTAFLNAVAKTDTYSLYNTTMATNLNIAGIARSGSSGSYTYSVIGSPNHPVTYVSWGDAARFANWLNNGQPTGPQNSTTTESGAYTLNGATSNAALYAVTRNASAKWFIPSENEWYKPAYYQPAAQGGDSDSYWLYPMKTNSVPYSDQPPGATPDNTRAGNFYQNDGSVNGYDDGYAVSGSIIYNSIQNYLTDAGAYSSSPGYYGTFDQGGNVWEWNDGQVDGLFRGNRGGSWGADATLLPATLRNSNFPSDEYNNVGFRVATLPEPTTAMLVVFAAIAMFGLLRRPF